jgi:hypothetical protein
LGVKSILFVYNITIIKFAHLTKKTKMKRIIHLLLIAGILAFAPSCGKEGCTDPKATNYNSKAKKDDGSCKFPPPPPVDTTDTIDKDTPQIRLLKRGNCVECITSNAFLMVGADFRIDLNVNYDKPLKNVNVVMNRIGIGTTTLLDTNITSNSLDALMFIATKIQNGEHRILTFTATGQNDKVGKLSISIKEGSGELNERDTVKIYQGNPDGDNKPHSYNLATGLPEFKFSEEKYKDINEPSTGTFLKKFNSLNGSKFKKYTGGKIYYQFKNQSELSEAWDASGNELSEVDLKIDDMILVKSTQNGFTYLIYIEDINSSVTPGIIKFSLKGQF